MAEIVYHTSGTMSIYLGHNLNKIFFKQKNGSVGLRSRFYQSENNLIKACCFSGESCRKEEMIFFSRSVSCDDSPGRLSGFWKSFLVRNTE